MNNLDLLKQIDELVAESWHQEVKIKELSQERDEIGDEALRLFQENWKLKEKILDFNNATFTQRLRYLITGYFE